MYKIELYLNEETLLHTLEFECFDDGAYNGEYIKFDGREFHFFASRHIESEDLLVDGFKVTE